MSTMTTSTLASSADHLAERSVAIANRPSLRQRTRAIATGLHEDHGEGEAVLVLAGLDALVAVVRPRRRARRPPGLGNRAARGGAGRS
jgi:hypothetical protein